MNPYTASLRPVWERPTVVSLDTVALDQFATSIYREDFPVPSWREPVFPADDDERFVNFVGVGNTINFAFTDFATHKTFESQYGQQSWRGAFGMWACLKRAYDEDHDFNNLQWLVQMSLGDMQQLFAGAVPIPMLQDRLELFHETGTVLAKRFGGSFWNLLQGCNFRAFGEAGFVPTLIRELPGFRDESVHAATGVRLKFQKRAQLLAMMYQGRAMSQEALPFLQDYELLGPIADYSVPKALHMFGILKYSDELETRVATGTIVQKDSVAEQEIRAQTVRAQVLLLERLNSMRDEKTNYLALDYKLWSAGRGRQHRHHLTQTRSY